MHVLRNNISQIFLDYFMVIPHIPIVNRARAVAPHSPADLESELTPTVDEQVAHLLVGSGLLYAYASLRQTSRFGTLRG